MRDKILNDMMAAMKNQDKNTLNVLRMVKGAMQLEEIKLKRNLNDDEVTSVLSREIKTRREAMTEFEKGNRNDLVEQNKQEIAILEKYMPEQLSDEALEQIISEAFATLHPEGVKDIGKIMGFLSPKIKGKADLGKVNKMIKERLEQD